MVLLWGISNKKITLKIKTVTKADLPFCLPLETVFVHESMTKTWSTLGVHNIEVFDLLIITSVRRGERDRVRGSSGYLSKRLLSNEYLTI